MPNFMFVDVLVIEFRDGTTHFQATVKLTLQVLHVFYRIILVCFLISLAFNMFFTLMLVEVKLSGI